MTRLRAENEVSETKAPADSFNAPHHTFTNMSPDDLRRPESLPAQSERFYANANPSPDVTPDRVTPGTR
jgi:hypothetical protein